MKKRFISKLLVLAMSVSLISGVSQPVMAADAAATSGTSLVDEQKLGGGENGPDIQNDIFWQDTDGNTIFSQGGGIFKFDDTYYWYGVKYEEAEKYAQDPSKVYNKDTFAGVTCYSSKDLINWKNEGIVVTTDAVKNPEIMGDQGAKWVGRLGVAKVGDKYALFVQHEFPEQEQTDPTKTLDYPDVATEGSGEFKGQYYSKQVLVLTSDTPNGQFTWNQRINMYSYTGGTSNTGDQTVFTDEETGKNYLVYSFGRGRGTIFLSEIVEQGDGKIGLDKNKTYTIYKGDGREGNCMFKYNGHYYVCASDLYGWNASHAYYIKLDNLTDEYLKSYNATKMELMDGCSDDFCHVTQTGFFYTVNGSEQETVIFCGDRWAGFAGNGLGFNQWCPLSFKEDGTPCFNSLSAWNLDFATGKWTVDATNNYVKNGSFDADRVAQKELAGWTNTITRGNAPINNNEKNKATGRFSLQLGDTTTFDCKVSQVIAQNTDTADAVQLPDGIYDLTAKIKNTANFDELTMYAESGDITEELPIEEANASFTEFTLSDITVSENKVEIGFVARGKANAYAYIDDVTLVRSEDQRAADAAIDMINNIGTVDATSDCKAKIDAAKEAYSKLTPAQQTLVENYKVLSEAQRQYDAAVASQKVDISKATVAAIPAQIYSGNKLTPAVTVTYNGVKLTKDTDYTLRYNNNVNIGTATVTIEGIGKYEKSVTKSFAITVNKNGEYTVGSYKYKVTDPKVDGKGTVAVVGGKSKTLKTVKIGAAVNIGGKSFNVTSIGKNAFKGYNKLSSVTIGKNITKIEAGAFEKCGKLKTIKISSSSLKSVGKNAIKGINKKATIQCPKKKVANYKKLFKSSTGYKKSMKIKK